MVLKVFPKYTAKGASSRYRTFQYIPFFEEGGFICKIYPFFDDKHIANINNNKRFNLLRYFKFILKRTFYVLFLKKTDIVFIEKELIPYFPPVLEKYLHIRNIKYILDYDDAIIHNYNLSENKFIRKMLSEKIPMIQKKASAVINGSNYLQKLSLQNNKKSYFIPTSLNPDKYFSAENNGKKEFVIGWIGSASTSKLILPILEIIENFCVKFNIKIHLIGFDTSLLKSKNGEIYNFIEWNEDTEVTEISKFNIGISPSKDTPFARGKCAFKSIQYMACEKPVITSPIGANADVVIHGKTGFHAKNTDDWFIYLEHLYKNPDLVKEMGKEGRKRVEQYYSVKNNYKKYIDIFNNLKK